MQLTADAAALGSTWTDPECPVARATDLIGDRWSILIVRDAMDGARSFTDFQRRTGIARNILADRLRRLVARGVLEQTDPESGRRRVYALTTAGRDLFPVIVALRQWGERHLFDRGEERSTLVDGAGTPLSELRPTDRSGNPVTDDDTRVVHPPSSSSHPMRRDSDRKGP